MEKIKLEDKIKQLETLREQLRAEMYVTIGRIAELQELLDKGEVQGLETGQEIPTEDGSKA